MLEDQINLSYFTPRLEKFYRETANLYNCGYFQGPFIPYTMPGYQNASTKIIYVGRDTYYWSRYVDLDKAAQSGNLNAYFISNVGNIDDEKMMRWGNHASAFWPTVMKLHLFLRTGIYFDDITSIGKKEKGILNEIGYGNLYSIEKRETLRNKGERNDIVNRKEYRKILKAAECFEGLRTIVEAYEPDYVVVLSWEELKFVDNISTIWRKDLSVEGIVEVSDILGRRTKLLWSNHPTRYKFLRINQKKMIPIIAEAFRKIHYAG